LLDGYDASDFSSIIAQSEKLSQFYSEVLICYHCCLTTPELDIYRKAKL